MCKFIVNGILLVLWSLTEVGDAINLYVKCKSCLQFPAINDTQHSITDVRVFLIDVTNDRVIVSDRDSLLRLDTTSLRLPSSQNDFVDLPPTSAAVRTCKELGFPSEQCFNYMRLALFDSKGNIFACGTFATLLRCWTFQRTGVLSPQPPGGIIGTGKSPQDYHLSVTGTFINQYLFTGVDNAAIYGSIPNDTRSDSVQTLMSTSVLNEAKFVSSFSYTDNFVYYFFRETAVERNKMIYSRVGRVCQYDEGSRVGILKNKFTSFVKARVMCSIQGEIPFDYDQIQAAFKYTDPKTAVDYIYGIFTTPQPGPVVSAVCMYSMRSIQDLFQKSKYLKETSTVLHDGSHAWVAISPVNLTVIPGRPRCNSDLKTLKYPISAYSFAAQHPLLAEPLTAVKRNPLFDKSDARFTQIVVDKVQRGDGQFTPVMFISTDNGTVIKVFINISVEANPVVVEQIEVFEKPAPILTMKLDKSALFIGSNSRVVKVPLAHCEKYDKCRTCVSVMDPYCGWSNDKCTTFSSKDGSRWAQDIVHGDYASVCPEAPPSCSVEVTEKRAGGRTVLRCQADGIPLPQITSWTKDNITLPNDRSFLIKQGAAIDQQRLVITKFGMQHLGMYQCVVSSTSGSSSCVVNVTGMLPVVSSALVKINFTTYFTCNASGLPTPQVAVYKVVKGKQFVVSADRVRLSVDAGQRSYTCVAQNGFGPTFGQTTNIVDKAVKAELRLTSETWSSALSDEKSEEYKVLSERVKTAVENSFAKNAAFLGFDRISFSKGSVICKMTLDFAAQPLDRNSNLLKDLQQDVSTGKLGDLTVDGSHVLNVEPDVELTTKLPTALPTTTLPAISKVLTPKTHVTMVTTVPPEPTPGYRQGDEMDSGLFAVAVTTAIVLSLILGFVLGVKFHSQAMRRCWRSSGDPESCDGAHNKSVEAVKYTKSPPREEHFPRNKNETQSKRNLLKKKGNRTEAAENSDSDSNGSGGGRLGRDGDEENEEVVTAPSSPIKSNSPSVSVNQTPPKKPSLENGGIPRTC